MHIYAEIINVMLFQVTNVLNEHRSELIEKRYRCNIGLFMCKFVTAGVYRFCHVYCILYNNAETVSNLTFVIVFCLGKFQFLTTVFSNNPVHRCKCLILCFYWTFRLVFN